MFAWARTGQQEDGSPLSFTLPPHHGFKVGPDNPLLFDIHLEVPQDYAQNQIPIAAGFNVSFSENPETIKNLLKVEGVYQYQLTLPPGSKDIVKKIFCHVEEDLHVVAYRNHAHQAARDIYSYVYYNGKRHVFGNMSAMEPQIFRHLDEPVTFRRNSVLEVHCHYTTLNETHTLMAGDNNTNHDEMCNQYYMAYTSETMRPFQCHSGLDTEEINDYHVSKDFGSLTTTTIPGSASSSASSTRLGQVSGVAHSPGDGSFGYVFARRENTYMTPTPIDDDAIFKVDLQTGTVVKNIPTKGLFIAPHGLHVDHWGNIWTTDTSTHQVLKLDEEGNILMKLGEHKVPGSDVHHFDRPTDVDVSQTTGEIYVSDGYGNSRIIVFDADGNFLRTWGKQRGSEPGSFNIPHNIALDEDDQVYVADRENRRVQVFSSGGELLNQWESVFCKRRAPPNKPWRGHLSALSYNRRYNVLFSVEGSYLTVRKLNGNIVGVYGGNEGSELGDLLWAHDVSIPYNGTLTPSALVGELDNHRVQQFVPVPFLGQ